jgi:hypothetical protein
MRLENSAAMNSTSMAAIRNNRLKKRASASLMNSPPNGAERINLVAAEADDQQSAQRDDGRAGQ